MINGNVTVLKGASCTIELATVTGNVHVSQGANLIVQAYSEPATIGGNIEADHCKSALLEGNSLMKPGLKSGPQATSVLCMSKRLSDAWVPAPRLLPSLST